MCWVGISFVCVLFGWLVSWFDLTFVVFSC